MSIQILPEHIASQIAAGEVVERPASVVKELVENAIDAAATTIHVEIRDGGRSFMQVADNGLGISAESVSLAFRRHATSKIDINRDADSQLSAISTLGFRGEALAAISSVSRVTMVTRTSTSSVTGSTGSLTRASGTRIVLEGGHLISQDQVGAPQGTVIAVENLFYNTPARLKFLKSERSERQIINQTITRYALAWPNIRFRLTHNGKETFHSSGNGKVFDVIVAIFGASTAREMLPIMPSEHPEDVIKVSGYAAAPSLSRGNRSQITLFVNGRWIKDMRLTAAVVQAYHTLLKVKRYPITIAFISMPTEMVDVNVHPAKTEVRFEKPGAVFGALQRAVRQTVVAEAGIQSVSRLAQPSHSTIDRHDWHSAPAYNTPNWHNRPAQPQLGIQPAAAPTTEIIGHNAPAPAPNLGGEKLPIMRVIGQISTAYIITEGPDGLFLVDQHAAHERVLFEQMMAAQQTEGIAAQRLVAPASIHLTPAQATLLEGQIAQFSTLGFEIEPFGPNTFMLRSVPAILAKRDPTEAVLDVLNDLEQGEKPLQSTIEARIILRVCKTAAIKAGQTLSRIEMEALMRQLEASESPHTCPHGRPTMIHLSMAQLAREFGRT